MLQGVIYVDQMEHLMALFPCCMCSMTLLVMWIWVVARGKEPWHVDIFEFLNLRKNHGKEEHCARDLFYGLWVPDLFMQRVQSNEHWSLFCPSECPGLADCWGEEFEALYTKYEREIKNLEMPRKLYRHKVYDLKS